MRSTVNCAYLPRNSVVRQRVKAIRSLLRPMSVANHGKIRLGRFGDGGYVCLDHFEGIEAAVSLGISDEVSWDLDVANLGFRVCQYDHTVDGPPIYHPNFVFKKLRVAGADGDGSICLDSILDENGIKNKHSAFLKMDIEGGEWEVFLSTSCERLESLSQIVCEFHFFSMLADVLYYNNAVEVFQKLNKVFQVVHIHGNNYGKLLICPDGGTLPETIEVTFASKSLFSFIDSNVYFPTSYDAPNNPELIDYFIDF